MMNINLKHLFIVLGIYFTLIIIIDLVQKFFAEEDKKEMIIKSQIMEREHILSNMAKGIIIRDGDWELHGERLTKIIKEKK